MKEYLSLDDTYTGEKPLAIALGFFDGIHLGHRHVINHAMAKKEEGFLPAVFTFSHTKTNFNKNNGFIYPLSYRKKQIEQLGAGVLLCPPFESFLGLSPEEFINKLAANFRVKHIVCGDDFTFGKNKAGTPSLLKKLGQELGITVEIVPPFLLEGERVSSTKIKGCLLSGDIKKANAMLGAPYCMSGVVKKGKQLGRTVDRPTANQHFEEDQLIPRFGAYSSVAVVQNKEWFCSSNIGLRPTVGGEYPICETYLLNFKGQLYGTYLEVYFFEFMRPEMKFDSLEDIKQNVTDIAEHARKKGYRVENLVTMDTGEEK